MGESGKRTALPIYSPPRSDDLLAAALVAARWRSHAKPRRHKGRRLTLQCSTMSPKTPLRALVIGAAGRGCVWAQAIKDHPLFNLTGLADLNSDLLQKSSDELAIPADQRFGDFHDAVTTGQFDVAFCVASTTAHFAITTDLLQSGLYCLIEKPFTLDMDQARQLVELARQKNRVLAVGQNYRFDSVRRFVSSAMQAGELGPLSSITGQFHRHRPPRPQDVAINYPLLFIQSIHHLDWLLSMLPASRVVSAVHGLPSCSQWTSPSVCHVQMQCDDIPISYSGSYEAQGDISPYGGLWRFGFERGDLLIDHDETVWQVTEQGSKKEKVFTPSKNDPTSEAVLLDTLHAGIVDSIEPPTSGRQNLATLQLVFDVIAAGERS